MWIFSVLSETEAQQRLSISRQILFCNFQKTCRNLVRVRALFCCQVLLRLQEELLCLPALLSHTHSHMKNAPMALSIWRAFLKCLACHINGVHTRFNLIQLSFRTGWKKKKKTTFSIFYQCVFVDWLSVQHAGYFDTIFFHISNSGPNNYMFWQLRFRCLHLYGVPSCKQTS